MKNPIILGIESSCDDTGAAIIENSKIRANIVANQKVHQEFGGVVPELASRAHQQNIVPVVAEAIRKANIEKSDIDAIAFTRGPGLMGSLLVGTSFAKSLALSLDIPLIEVNHMQAHIMAHFIDGASKSKPNFPFLCLTISGGHTQIVKVTDYFTYEVIGETLDDAVGEAFDKVAKILDLGYPGGPLIDKLAAEGNPKKYQFPKPKVAGLNFSFSGVKTAVLYFLQKEMKLNPNFIQENKHDICASVQYTLVTILIDKLKEAVKQTGISNLAIAGGVSANSQIRKRLEQASKIFDWQVSIPKFEYTTDNAAMIAMVGALKYKENKFANLSDSANSRYKI